MAPPNDRNDRRPPRQQRDHQGHDAQGDDAAQSFDLDNLLNEGIESLGDNLGEAAVPKLMRRIAAGLYRAGIRNAAGLGLAVVTIKAAIKTRTWKPNVKAFLEGLVEGLEDGLKFEFRRFREIEQDQGKDALRKEIGKILAPRDADHGRADPHVGHGTDHGKVTPVSTAAARDAKTIMGFITRLPSDKRRKAMDFWRAFRAEAPNVFALIEQCQTRDGFLERLFERIDAYWDDQDFMAEAVKDLLGEELKAIEIEKSHKPVARLRHVIGGVFGALEDGLTAMGVPERSQITHAHNDDNHPVGSGFGDDWGNLQDRLRNR